MSVDGLSTAEQCSLSACGKCDGRTIAFPKMMSSGTACSIFTFPEGHRRAAYVCLLVFSSLYLNSSNMFQQTVSTQNVNIRTSQHTNCTFLINSFFTITISLIQFPLHTILIISPHDPYNRSCHTLNPVSTANKS
jgi:hypothetical protein